MKAIQVSQVGGPEVLEYKDVPVPEPGPEQVLIKSEVIGVNFIDVYHRTGLYPRPLPFIPGLEAAGTVEAVGEEVTHLEVGDRVAYAANPGAYAEQTLAQAWSVVKLPEAIDFPTATALMVQGLTAHYLSHSTFPLREGHRVLVHAAAGGVGLLLVQLAKIKGARVAGTVSTPEKAEVASNAGVDRIINYTKEDFETAVRGWTAGDGVDVVYDSVGQTTFSKSLNCLKPRGMLVSFGQSSGPVPPFDIQILSQKGALFITRPTLHHYIPNRDELVWRASDLMNWVAGGLLSVRLGQVFPLSEAYLAHQALQGRKTTGKVILLPERQGRREA